MLQHFLERWLCAATINSLLSADQLMLPWIVLLPICCSEQTHHMGCNRLSRLRGARWLVVRAVVLASLTLLTRGWMAEAASAAAAAAADKPPADAAGEAAAVTRTSLAEVRALGHGQPNASGVFVARQTSCHKPGSVCCAVQGHPLVLHQAVLYRCCNVDCQRPAFRALGQHKSHTNHWLSGDHE